MLRWRRCSRPWSRVQTVMLDRTRESECGCPVHQRDVVLRTWIFSLRPVGFGARRSRKVGGSWGSAVTPTRTCSTPWAGAWRRSSRSRKRRSSVEPAPPGSPASPSPCRPARNWGSGVACRRTNAAGSCDPGVPLWRREHGSAVPRSGIGALRPERGDEDSDPLVHGRRYVHLGERRRLHGGAAGAASRSPLGPQAFVRPRLT